MSRQGNVQRAKWTVEQLGADPGARVLELGYGPGLALAAMGDRIAGGSVVGVDLSEVMRRQAARRNADRITAGKLELRVGDAQTLDSDLSELDLIYAINVWQFWPDQVETIDGLRERLSTGGRLALVYMQPPAATTTAKDAEELLQQQFSASGFQDIQLRTMEFDPPALMVIGCR